MPRRLATQSGHSSCCDCKPPPDNSRRERALYGVVIDSDGGSDMHRTTHGVSFVRTPDDRFNDLPDFDYPPRYVDVDGLRMAYIDVGPTDAPPVLLLHGEPAWSFLYRRMIPLLVEAGYRCIAPDLIGFGRSDKPVDQASYTYNGHVAWMQTFLDGIDLAPGARLFGQDWGGLIGLRLVAERPPVRRGRDRQHHPARRREPWTRLRCLAEFSQSPRFSDVGIAVRARDREPPTDRRRDRRLPRAVPR